MTWAQSGGGDRGRLRLGLGVLVWGLWRYARLSLWHIVLIALFGFLLASTKAAPNIREGLRELFAYLAGIDP